VAYSEKKGISYAVPWKKQHCEKGIYSEAGRSARGTGTRKKETRETKNLIVRVSKIPLERKGGQIWPKMNYLSKRRFLRKIHSCTNLQEGSSKRRGRGGMAVRYPKRKKRGPEGWCLSSSSKACVRRSGKKERKTSRAKGKRGGTATTLICPKGKEEGPCMMPDFTTS